MRIRKKAIGLTALALAACPRARRVQLQRREAGGG